MNLEILTKWENSGKMDLKTLNFVLMLVMRFLTDKQVLKTPRWYLTQTFGEKLKKHCKIGKKGKNIFFHLFFILLKRNTNVAKYHSDSQKNEFMNPENLKILSKWI